MLGLFERTPRFVKRYDDLASRIGEAAGQYAAEVRDRSFPTADQTYRPKALVFAPKHRHPGLEPGSAFPRRKKAGGSRVKPGMTERPMLKPLPFLSGALDEAPPASVH
jgi:hypothetical protein